MQKDWLFDKRRFMIRNTLLFGLGWTALMVFMLGMDSLDLAILWLFVALIGLAGGYVWSLLMWNFFGLGNSRKTESDQR